MLPLLTPCLVPKATLARMVLLTQPYVLLGDTVEWGQLHAATVILDRIKLKRASHPVYRVLRATDVQVEV